MSAIQSPCRDICQVDSAGKACLGCGRTVAEIEAWLRYTPAQREAVSLRVRQWWGDDVKLEFTDFDGLVRGGWRNKFRYLVDAAPAA